jgi:branched-chain amino acid transport system permease protein
MPTLPQFLSQAFNGIALGSLLALIASGLSIILGTLGVLNFAHGAMFMLGAYSAFIVLRTYLKIAGCCRSVIKIE